MSDRPRILALFGGATLFGQERGNIEALAALKEQGCDVLCLIRNDPWAERIPPALEIRGLSWLKVPYIEHRLPGRLFHVIFRNPIVFVRANWQFWRIVKRFRPTHIHAFNPLYVLNFLPALTVSRLPMVYRAGDEPTAHNVIWRLIWRFVVWRTDRFVANAKFVESSLHRHGVGENRTTLIYNAPPCRGQGSDKTPLPTGPAEASLIVYVGQISEHKGVHLLVDAFKSLAGEFPSATLAIAGRISLWSGDAWARQLKEDAVRDPLLAGRIEFLGEIEDVPSLLSTCTIHVAPSLFDDPSPNVIMEAKQVAKPSIVFPKGGMPELVENGVEGIVCSECTAEGLATALRCYLTDGGLAQQHGQAALASLNRLGVQTFAMRWFEVYASVPNLQQG